MGVQDRALKLYPATPNFIRVYTRMGKLGHSNMWRYKTGPTLKLFPATWVLKKYTRSTVLCCTNIVTVTQTTATAVVA